jgi:DNA-binding Lrp family transcriptional regulator
MQNLDLKDKKILYELDFNARQSNASIGKKVGLSKDIVNRRVKKTH